MRILFEMDKNDYADCTRSFVRNSARSIIISDKKVAMIHSEKYGYYKFPGGGIEAGEDPIEAMIRETREEAGLVIIPESAKEYGIVHRVQKSDNDPAECFVQDNYTRHAVMPSSNLSWTWMRSEARTSTSVSVSGHRKLVLLQVR